MTDARQDEPTRAGRPWRRRSLLGWLVVVVNVAVAGLWAFWGSIEAFHEGWHHETTAANVAWMFAYLWPALIFTVLGLVALRWPRVGGSIYVLIAVAIIMLFLFYFNWNLSSSFPAFLMGGGGGLFGVLWWFGRPCPKRWAVRLTWGLPLLVALVFGAYPAYMVATRYDDGDRALRVIEGNGVRLAWAPAGPGWPDRGLDWNEAVRRCRHLTEDGLALADVPRDIWRLPTVDEVVRSMTRRNENAGGAWDPAAGRATFRTRPGKESPLWDTRSRIIYWWTADEVDPDRAYRVVYHGGVWAIRKNMGMGSQGFRAVRDEDDRAGRD